jgi:cellulose synthase/poly-beta-1,6-N-acetylglucosamine synthase-like glycosyltransferase
MLVYFYIIFALYYIFVLALWYGWTQISSSDIPLPSKLSYRVSVVVALRNEAQNVEALLRSLSQQQYTGGDYEIVLVDDHSEDDTVSVVENFRPTSTTSIKLLRMSNDRSGLLSGKKGALSKAISTARGEVILVTDGDCRMGPGWVASMVYALKSSGSKFVSGPVVIKPIGGIFAKIQSLEFLSLMGSGAALIGLYYPLMCNGANLAFEKKAFEVLGGYDGTDQFATGDDVFLMQKFHRIYQKSVIFSKSAESMVYTTPLDTVQEFLAQRRRWASKWSHFLLPGSWIVPVFLFIHYLSVIGLTIFALHDTTILPSAVVLILLKLLIDYLFLRNVTKFCNLPLGILTFVACEVIYPVYALVVGLSVHYHGWKWKGRKHRR